MVLLPDGVACPSCGHVHSAPMPYPDEDLFVVEGINPCPSCGAVLDYVYENGKCTHAVLRGRDA